MTITGEPAILYFGTPVALISSQNEVDSANLAPMSSVFWLGWRAVLGLSAASQTAQNLCRTREAVINLPSSDMADVVDRLALTTGADPVPDYKIGRGYRHVRGKFDSADATASRRAGSFSSFFVILANVLVLKICTQTSIPYPEL